jgi:hypothetical protein
MAAPSHVAFKPFARFTQKRRRQGKVVLRSRKVFMPQVSGQSRQQILKVSAASIPGDEPVNRRGVSQIVQAGLSSCSAWTGHTRNPTQQTKCLLDCGPPDALAVAHPEKGTIRASRRLPISAPTVLDQYAGQIPTQWNQSQLEKFGLPHGE